MKKPLAVCFFALCVNNTRAQNPATPLDPASTPPKAPAIHGATLRPLDPASVDDFGKSQNSNVGAIIDFVNRSGRPVDIYWIDFNGNRVQYYSGVADGATVRMRTFLTHPWLAVASGTGGTKARGTGVLLAAYEAITPNPKFDQAIRDVGVIAVSNPAPHLESESLGAPPAIPESVALTVIPSLTAKEAKEILDKAAGVYSHLTSLRVSGKSEEVQLNRGQELMSDAHFELAVQGGREYYLRFKLHGVEAVAVSDGESTWKALVSRKQFSHVDAATVDDPAENEVAQRPKNDLYTYMGRSLFGEVPLLARKATNLEMVREADYKLSSGRVRCYVIRAQSDKGQEELWIDKERFLVLDRIRTFKSGVLSRTNRFSLTAIEVNKEIPQSTFHFEPPKNWSEEELVLLPGEQGQSLTGSRAWRFNLKALDGERTELTEGRGKVVVLDFWATWCPPCRRELPVIEKLSAEFSDKVLFYGVNDEDSSTVKDFVKKNQYHMTVLMDNNKEVHRQYGVSAIPTLLIIDKQGIIRKLFVGSRDEATLRKAVQSVVNLN
jgi:thiol-disulfide isomerase/thioredoxin